MDLRIPALSQPDGPTAQRQTVVLPKGALRAEAMAARTALNGEAREGRDPPRAAQAGGVGLETRIRFEYEQAHRVMKVHDSRGVLIYQVPPQGALQLILQAEARASRLRETA